MIARNNIAMSNWRELLRLQQEGLGIIPDNSNLPRNFEKPSSFEQSKKISVSPRRKKLAATISTVDTNNNIHLSSDHVTSEPPSLDVPEATQRYQVARIKLLSQQLREHDENRKHLAEEVADLRRQLKVERDESVGLKKRYTIK